VNLPFVDEDKKEGDEAVGGREYSSRTTLTLLREITRKSYQYEAGLVSAVNLSCYDTPRIWRAEAALRVATLRREPALCQKKIRKK